MKILHGTWIPKSGTGFVRGGGFYLWVETDTIATKSKDKSIDSDLYRHPQHLAAAELRDFLTESLGIQVVDRQQFSEVFTSQYFLLPSHHDRPLSSLELARYLETELPDSFDLEYWQIDCYQMVMLNSFKLASNVIKLLKDIHFLTINDLTEVQMGDRKAHV